MPEEFRSFFSTQFGVGAVYASESGVVKVVFPEMTKYSTAPDISSKHSSLTEYASELLCRYFGGEPIELADIPVDLTGIPLFRHKALDVIRGVKYGEIRSYGQIAALCGSPLASRAVGGAMASNPVPIIIPCHRIVGGDGRLTGFSASGGINMKRLLLEMEGVEFKRLLAIQKKLVINR